ncbi:hypothetical protein [Aneurinibacillus aneurinilyticus]|jgi:hypothetical protein|uniref:Uncharacterized protein n=1 Tax=Aneurinibacillus aneurinilyticus TaxID=1391 RepID=A0A848CWB1_ANEAE|nr:hypothetical protein [Aneurinibacillus aneurinilyticus]MED0670498.1 hypothetical protein [Aneurinibacillus aneurinilyticus]MED0734830.1 hypothetical protein [Aneurinibacillus aneurinilyticus]MED0742425.1 hypothetical protein [Aneurinibacillus aneurinilyticus]NME97656.1 hypothetical protein [Aneurinibacillus aneurinilyticus]
MISRFQYNKQAVRRFVREEAKEAEKERKRRFERMGGTIQKMAVGR